MLRSQTSAETMNPIQRHGYVLLVLYFIVVFGRLPELLAQWAGVRLPVAAGLLGALLVVALLSGNILLPFKTIPGRFLIAFHVWMVLAAPFSFWKMGTLQTLTIIARFFAIFVCSTCLLVTIKQCRSAMYGIASSVFVIMAGVLVSGTPGENRFTIGRGSLGNPNELAAILLMILPFWFFIAGRGRFPVLTRILSAGAVSASVLIVLRTGSRGGLVTGAGLVLVMFWTYSLSGKLKMLAALPFLVAAVVLLTPSSSMERYRTILEESITPSLADVAALSSTEARKYLVKQSWRLTLEHPVFGVGTGVYAAAAADEAEGEGRRTGWQVAHNAYLQVSAETGIPGLILYLATLISLIAGLVKVRRQSRKRPEAKEVSDMARTLLLAFAAFCIYGLFSSVQTEFYFYVLAGLAVSFTRLARANWGMQDAAATGEAVGRHAPSGPLAAPPRTFVAG